MEQFDAFDFSVCRHMEHASISPHMGNGVVWKCIEYHLGEEEQHSYFHLLALIFYDLG
jgi:hypothetical protein